MEGDNILDSPASWRDLFNFTNREQLLYLSFASILALFAGMIAPVQAIIFGKIFQAFVALSASSSTEIYFLSDVSKQCLSLIWLGIVTWLVHGCLFYFWGVFGAVQGSNAEMKVFQDVLTQNIPWFDCMRSGPGSFATRTQTHISELRAATSHSLGMVIHLAATVIASLAIAMLYSWRLTLVIVSSFPIIGFLHGHISSRIQSSIREQAATLEAASKLVATSLDRIETVKLFNGQRHEIRKYERTMQQASHYSALRAQWVATQSALMSFFAMFIFTPAFWYGSHSLSQGWSDAETVITTFWSTSVAVEAMMQLVPLVATFERGKVAGAVLSRTLCRSVGNKICADESSPIIPENCLGKVDVKDLSFAFPANVHCPVLKNLSMTFTTGQITFIIGPSGSGKSSLARLLIRLYEPDAGVIELDGIPIKKIDPSWLTKTFTFVEQDTVLFLGDILSNILLEPQASNLTSPPDITAALQFSELVGFINELPEGIHTAVGGNNTPLSGGQRQRIALARARLRDSPVLILDEPTSALDPALSWKIMDNIRTWRSGKTTIIITHETSHILPHDNVVIMAQGQIVETGCWSTIPRAAANQAALSPSLQLPQIPRIHATCPDSAVSEVHDGDSRGHSPSSDLNFRRIAGRIITNMGCFVSQVWKRASRPLLTHDNLNNLPLELQDIHYCPIYNEDPPTTHRLRDNGLLCSTDSLPLFEILYEIMATFQAPARYTFLLPTLAGLLHGLATPVFSYLFSHVLSTFTSVTKHGGIAHLYLAAIVGLGVVDGLAAYIFSSRSAALAEVWVNRSRTEAFRRVIDQPMDFFAQQEHGTSYFTDTLDRHAEEARNLVCQFLTYAYVASVIAIAAIIWSLMESWKLTGIGIISAPVLFVASQSYIIILAKKSHDMHQYEDIVAAIFMECVANIKTVRALGLEEYFHSKFSTATRAIILQSTDGMILCSILCGVSHSVLLFAASALFYFGGILASQSTTSDHEASQVLLVFVQILFGMSSVNGILGDMPRFSACRDGATRLLRLSRLVCSSHEHEGTTKIAKIDDIAVQSLNFQYRSRLGQNALSDVNIYFPRGSCSAVVGRSGSGKSTLAALLVKLHEVYRTHENRNSRILLSDQDIEEVHTHTLRNRLSLVPQATALLSATVLENILYGIPDSDTLYSLVNARRAASLVGVHEFILSLPLGYNTAVGEGGLELSGGQVQRIAIARGLARMPDVLILDEPTSALDIESATIVRESILGLLGKVSRVPSIMGNSSHVMTVILLTHAEDMMAVSDQVVVLERGQVVESGPFEQLRGAGGFLSKVLER